MTNPVSATNHRDPGVTHQHTKYMSDSDRSHMKVVPGVMELPESCSSVDILEGLLVWAYKKGV